MSADLDLSIEMTRLAKSGGPLTKRISLTVDGSLKSDGSACLMSAGTAQRAFFNSLQAFAATITGLQSHEAIAMGALRLDLSDKVEIVTKERLEALNGTAGPDLIARTSDHIIYRPDHPALALLDIDTKGMPSAVRDKVKEHGGYQAALESIIPELAASGKVVRQSTSTGIRRTDTGQMLSGSEGAHIFVLVNDGADVERFLRTLHARCWLHGFGWMMVGAGGQLLERSIVDRMVYAPERLVFEGAPVLDQPLEQDIEARRPRVIDGRPLDTRAVCLDLSAVETARLRELRAAEARRLEHRAHQAKAEFLEKQAERIAERTGCTVAEARKVAECESAGSLLPPAVLCFDTLGDATVGEILAHPDRFIGATLADPLEGIEYGRCKAKVMRHTDGTLWINSFAHGRTTYDLQYDYDTIEKALRAAKQEEAADVLVRLLMAADLAPDEEQRLRELASKLSGVKARPLGDKIKAARKVQKQVRAKEARIKRDSASHDKRLRITAPSPDEERLPVMRTLDEVLCNTGQAEPPVRDLGGHPVEIICRPPLALHELSTNGSNQAESEKTRLPPPKFPLITKHTRNTLAHEIERHVSFIRINEDEGDRAVALYPVFVQHYHEYRKSQLPLVGAVVTAPLVLPDGTLLAREGLDRDRKIVFRIEPALMALLPDPQHCRNRRAIADALDFLTNDWLCDVETDFTGKCVLISMALSILERALLPERPAFFVTAGKRGGGKTTALTMIILAVTGKKPAAAAWSGNDEERRKAMLAHLAEGLAALVWDNIPLGATVSCPTLEKVLTADSYSDRILGESENLTVPTHTIMAFTGNNIAPCGDLASRSLRARIEVDRPDPENRTFRHPDPIAWTLDNRGKILACLYTLLLGNPQFQAATRREPKTRFKAWWNLVGAAVEHANECLIEKQIEQTTDWPATPGIDFKALFAAVEAEDEEAAGLAEVLDILHTTWSSKLFRASEVVDLILRPTYADDDANATVMRSYFEAPGRRGPGTITPKSVGKRLSAALGAPVSVEGKTLKLTRGARDKGGATWFCVRTCAP